ncbi:MAG: hypothetical protein KDA88_02170 [Planctomycetaceae bacterium]|nr:hypothetical protein [Planctomycetaceae bacterium]MCB9953653.1 hypothetical protein [Planctomycetaceae bacterium]
MATKFETSLELTREEHSGAFERFANAFLVDDYPELEAIGGKHDGAMDARIIEENGNVVLVVQTCVSPKETARTKILHTVAILKENETLPSTLVYCTPAKIGNALDSLKRELRSSERLSLEIHDFAWLSQREMSTQHRARRCERYAGEILAPLLRELDPNTLYLGVLSDEQQRLAFQYLEAHNLDRRRGGNITKHVFTSLVLYATRDSNPPASALSEEQIVSSITGLFPEQHRDRVTQIVRGRIEHLVNKKVLHFNKQADGFVLAAEHRKAFANDLQRIRERDAHCRANLLELVHETISEREIDYAFDRNETARAAHSCVLWFMKVQADRFVDPFGAISGLIYADAVVADFWRLHAQQFASRKIGEAIDDVLPHVVYKAVNSADKTMQLYLREKADHFITQSFLQTTPDVHEACKSLIGQDIIFLDTSALIRCVAELYSETGKGPLTTAIRSARHLAIQFRVWMQHIDELVAHLRGPILLEWENHFKELPEEERDPFLWSAPTLLGVFHEASVLRNRTFPSLVEEILGRGNEWENTVEFLQEELGVRVEECPKLEDNEEWKDIFGEWLGNKRRSKTISDDRFELLVRNDVNAYLGVVQARRGLKAQGKKVGQKVWMLTFDGMVWKIPKLIGHRGDQLFEVGMTMDYVINYVATAVSTGMLNIPEEALSATALIGETEGGISELREVVTEKWLQPGEKKYMQQRRLRDLVHQVKTEQIREDDSDSAGDADEAI